MKNLWVFGCLFAVAASIGSVAIHLWNRSAQHYSAASAAAAEVVDETGFSERQKMARMIARIAARSAAQTTKTMIADPAGEVDVAHIEAAQAVPQAAAEPN